MPEFERLILAGAILGVYAVFCVWILRRGRPAIQESESRTLVAYASQTGSALGLAEQTLTALQGNAKLLPLNLVNKLVLAGTDQLLIVASTYGEGEAPDNGGLFTRHLQRNSANDLSHLEFAVLALGDSSYNQFCHFGRSLHACLAQQGARPVGEPLELDAQRPEKAAAILGDWYQQLSAVSDVEATGRGVELNRFHHTKEYQSWVLSQRVCLNTGSPGEPLYHLKFSPADSAPCEWMAGDTVEYLPSNSATQCLDVAAHIGVEAETQLLIEGTTTTLVAELKHRQLPSEAECLSAQGLNGGLAQWIERLPKIPPRQYSIASVLADGTLDLVVRLQRNPSGKTGLASGILTQEIPVGGTIEFCINPNPLFRTPEPTTPLVLIGNGSGIAGLRSHLHQRQLTGGGKNWLLFGERDPSADRPFDAEITEWTKSGMLDKVDLAFSRNGGNSQYVQDRLRDAAAELIVWIDQGAVLMVCGSREGMAQEVESALLEILGETKLQQLQLADRYRRDVY